MGAECGLELGCSPCSVLQMIQAGSSPQSQGRQPGLNSAEEAGHRDEAFGRSKLEGLAYRVSFSYRVLLKVSGFGRWGRRGFKTPWGRASANSEFGSVPDARPQNTWPPRASCVFGL